MQIPQAQALKLLGCEIHPCIRRAGFHDWQFPAVSDAKWRFIVSIREDSSPYTCSWDATNTHNLIDTNASPQGSPAMRVQSRLFAEWNRERELQHGSVAATKGIIRLYCGDFLGGNEIHARIKAHTKFCRHEVSPATYINVHAYTQTKCSNVYTTASPPIDYDIKVSKYRAKHHLCTSFCGW